MRKMNVKIFAVGHKVLQASIFTVEDLEVNDSHIKEIIEIGVGHFGRIS